MLLVNSSTVITFSYFRIEIYGYIILKIEFLTLTCISASTDSVPLVSAVSPGSAAHRSGCITPGDKVLSVSGISLFGWDAAQAASYLNNKTQQVVTLKIQKDETLIGKKNLPMPLSSL